MPKRCHNERLLDARHYPYADGSDDCCIRAGLVVEYYCLPRLGKVTGSAPMSKRPLLCRFLDAGKYGTAHAQATGVQKAPRHEVAGSWARAGQQALWGFDVGAELDGGRDISATPIECLQGGQAWRVQWAFRRALGAHQRAIGTLMDLIGSREIAAGMEPARRTEKAARSQ